MIDFARICLYGILPKSVPQIVIQKDNIMGCTRYIFQSVKPQLRVRFYIVSQHVDPANLLCVCATALFLCSPFWV